MEVNMSERVTLALRSKQVYNPVAVNESKRDQGGRTTDTIRYTMRG